MNQYNGVNNERRRILPERWKGMTLQELSELLHSATDEAIPHIPFEGTFPVITSQEPDPKEPFKPSGELNVLRTTCPGYKLVSVTSSDENGLKQREDQVYFTPAAAGGVFTMHSTTLQEPNTI